MANPTQFVHNFPSLVVSNVSVIYKTATTSKSQLKNVPPLKRAFGRLIGKDPQIKVHAVNNVSFVARKGDFIGLLGHNGAGKSTLMRIMAGVESPASGKIYSQSQPVLMGVNAALLPHLSGYENARLGCLAMGMSPDDAEAALPGIVTFSSLGDAIYRPMNTYSSGMGARLRFAISTAGNPEILLIDEALSTGDASFQEKSEERMNGMLERAGTIFLVSHSAETIEKMCNRAIWLHEGNIIGDGPAEEIARQYRWWAWCVAKGDDEKAARAIDIQLAKYTPKEIVLRGKPKELEFTAPRHRKEK